MTYFKRHLNVVRDQNCGGLHQPYHQCKEKVSSLKHVIPEKRKEKLSLEFFLSYGEQIY